MKLRSRDWRRISASPPTNMTNLTRELDDADFAAFVGYAYRLTGIQLDDSKRHLVISRLIRRVRKLGLGSLGDYHEYLSSHLEQEKGEFVNAITTNLTSFFRENHHFKYLKNWVRSEHTGSIDVWSAACSTGQEPYSIAMTLLESGAGDRCSVQATDIDTAVLEVGRRGEYKLADIEELDLDRRRAFFLRGTGKNEGQARVKEKVRQLVTFNQLNLMEPWGNKSKHYDVIFCRNVFIYFDKNTQQMMLRRFAEHLKPGGILFLGHSEAPRETAGLFVLDGRSTYRRVQG